MAGERTEMRRPAVKMAAAMMPAAEMASSTTEMMSSTAMMTAAAATTVPAAASRDGKVRHGQRRHKNKDGHSQSEFRHGASDHCRAASFTARG